MAILFFTCWNLSGTALSSLYEHTDELKLEFDGGTELGYSIVLSDGY